MSASRSSSASSATRSACRPRWTSGRGAASTRDATSVFADGAASPALAPVAIELRTQQSLAELRTLAQSHVPARRSAGIRAEVVVRGPGGAPAARMARFTETAFFTMFERPFATGGPWPGDDDEGRGETLPVVLGLATGRALFPRGDALGATVIVDGRPHRVVGVLARHEPVNAPWQLLITGGREDALFLPLGDFDRLGAWPEQPLYRTAPAGPGRAALLASDARFVISWVDLPAPAITSRSTAAISTASSGSGGACPARCPSGAPPSPCRAPQTGFFTSFLGIVSTSCPRRRRSVFTLARFTLTKGLTRGPELGVYRALGAPRGSILARAWTEAMLLGVPAALLGPVMALPMVWIFNRFVRVVDIPLELTPFSLAVSVLTPMLACAVGALYPAWRLSRTRPTVYLGMG